MFIPSVAFHLPARSPKILRPELKPDEANSSELLDAFDQWDGLMNADSRIAPMVIFKCARPFVRGF